MNRRFIALAAAALALSIAVCGGAFAEVRVRMAEEVSDLSNCDEFVASDSEFRTRVVFSADRAVRDFKFLSLMMEGWDEKNDKALFTVEELHSQPELTPERPLAVTLVFVGDLPNNGISYVDEAGATRRFALATNESGEGDYLMLIDF